MSELLVASNRGPVSFGVGPDGEVVARQGAGGLAPSLVSALAGSGATWIAAPMSDEDRRVAAAGGDVEVEGIRLRLVDMPAEVQSAAYNVVANGTLWFVQHGLLELARRPVFDRRWAEAWESYREYNLAFARTVAELAPEGATVVVHDYHLMLCGRELAALRPDLRTVHFTHTPWCSPGELAVLPDAARQELIEGMSSFGACGFHTVRWAGNFEACAKGVVADVPPTFAAALGADADRINRVASSEACRRRRRELDESLGDRRLLLRSDRVELSKNLVRGFLAYDALLGEHPEWRERVVFVAHAYGSREGLAEYLQYRAEVELTVERVNERWARPGWDPIVLEVADDYAASVAALTRYDVLLVNPIRDGLNLVAKEGPIVNDRDGVLALSREAGAYAELREAALDVHPYDVAATARALAAGLEMGAEERATRAAALRTIAAAATPSSWLEVLVRHARRPVPFRLVG